jgi:hypothetical protein
LRTKGVGRLLPRLKSMPRMARFIAAKRRWVIPDQVEIQTHRPACRRSVR